MGHRRGKMTKWARQHFTCTTPHGECPPTKRLRALASSASKDEHSGCSDDLRETYSDTTVPYRCNRCGGAVIVPRLAATGRPDLTPLAVHLQETGECASGVLRFEDFLHEESKRADLLRDEDEAALTSFLCQQLQNESTPKSSSFDIVTIWLLNPKTPQNMGSVLRAMSVYQDGAAIVYSGDRYDTAARFSTDPCDAGANIPKLHVHDMGRTMEFVSSLLASEEKRRQLALADCASHFVAVDLISEAVPLHRFEHSNRRAESRVRLVGYVFGPEDGTITPDVLGQCHQAVYIPTKGSMNLAATVNVLLYDRQAKRLIEDPSGLEALACDSTSGRSLNNKYTTALLAGQPSQQ